MSVESVKKCIEYELKDDAGIFIEDAILRIVYRMEFLELSFLNSKNDEIKEDYPVLVRAAREYYRQRPEFAPHFPEFHNLVMKHWEVLRNAEKINPAITAAFGKVFHELAETGREINFFQLH